MTSRMKALVLVQVVALAAILSTVAVHAETGYGGTIHYRDGTSVQFEWFGDINNVRRAFLRGQLGARNIELNLYEVREVIFAESSRGYTLGVSSSPGQMIVVNRAGERFIIDEAQIRAPRSGAVRYVYQHPISRVLEATSDRIENTVASITIGEYVGTMKHNPETGEFFPPTFVYDPYTGHRLGWATP